MKHKINLRLFASAFAIIGIGTIFFNGAANAVMAESLKSTQSVPTSYQVPAPTVMSTPDDYQKAAYHVQMDELNTANPTAADLTMEEAAELGAQYLWNIYEVNLEDARIYMMYTPGTQTFPRAFWSGDVLFSKDRTPDSTRWTFSIDAVTGELFDTAYSEKLNVNVSLGADAALAENYSTYAQLAKNLVGRCNLLNSPVSEVIYNCQGYSGNNPDITLDVIGENGNRVSVTFSRYDQKLLGIITDSSKRITDSAWDDAVGEAVMIIPAD